MKFRKVVIALSIFAFMMVTTAKADMQCFGGIGWYDECGHWNCYMCNAGGYENCMVCSDEIWVLG